MSGDVKMMISMLTRVKRGSLPGLTWQALIASLVRHKCEWRIIVPFEIVEHILSAHADLNAQVKAISWRDDCVTKASSMWTNGQDKKTLHHAQLHRRKTMKNYRMYGRREREREREICWGQGDDIGCVVRAVHYSWCAKYQVLSSMLYVGASVSISVHPSSFCFHVLSKCDLGSISKNNIRWYLASICYAIADV